MPTITIDGRICQIIADIDDGYDDTKVVMLGNNLRFVFWTDVYKTWGIVDKYVLNSKTNFFNFVYSCRFKKARIQHRDKGPAFKHYVSGILLYEEWVYKNNTHRLDGPAAIRYNHDGSIQEERYFIENECFNMGTWEDRRRTYVQRI